MKITEEPAGQATKQLNQHQIMPRNFSMFKSDRTTLTA